MTNPEVDMQVAYWTILIALAAAAVLRRPSGITRATLAVAGCGIASLILARVLVWPSDAYAFAMMAVDAIAAYIVLKPPPALWSAIIGATYLTQIGLHAGRIIRGDSDMSGYYLGLSFMAFAQLAIIGGWWLDERLIRRHVIRRLRAAAAPTHREGDAP
jgi:hypothetical protein